MSSRRGNRGPVKQTTPSFQVLLDRYMSGLRSQKEITRRVKAADTVSDEDRPAFDKLEKICNDNGWL